MNWLDFAIIFVLIGFVAAAYAAGLIREAVTLVAAILGIIIAGLLYDDLAADILVFMDDEDAAQAISFLILVGAVYLFGQIIALMLSRTASLLMLGGSRGRRRIRLPQGAARRPGAADRACRLPEPGDGRCRGRLPTRTVLRGRCGCTAVGAAGQL